ncbi:hypothetical protein BELL_0206g00130 [Botrytis elliptica]|uniref:3-beta hydroxysteroid dehydrogenase/isomerase domain-containing protein n=1 Tax=Botrytis elliptica TaxID=278938 RepID=A0A4Z1K2P1_9HELO|nr:hypothetical protein BELL_0206g00130 [Botrytis elliptica]
MAHGNATASKMESNRDPLSESHPISNTSPHLDSSSFLPNGLQHPLTASNPNIMPSTSHKSVLVTDGCGCLGHHIVRQLIEDPEFSDISIQNHQVSGVTR